MKIKRAQPTILILSGLLISGLFLYQDYIRYHQKNLIVVMKSSSLAFAQVFFDTGHGYRESDSSCVLLDKEGFHSYSFPLSHRFIQSIRFDPVNAPAAVSIKAAWIENSRGEIVRRFSLDDFRVVQQINDAQIQNGLLMLQMEENAIDPILHLENSSVHDEPSWQDDLADRSLVIAGYVLAGLFLGVMPLFLTRNSFQRKAKGRKDIFCLNVGAIIVSLIILGRWWYYIYAYAVNVLFWDQWDWYEAFIAHKNVWEIFRMQWGPHRMGLGLMLTQLIALWSEWNTRVEGFVIGGLICLALLMALVIRIKFARRLCWTDVILPLMFLTPLQYEIFAGTPNLSHGAVPLLMLMTYGFILTLRPSRLWPVMILVLNFLLIYTGYGVFVGVITPWLFLVEGMRAYRSRDRKTLWMSIMASVVAMLSFGSFFIGYHFSPAIENFKFPVSEWWQYFQFVALMLANFLGVKGPGPFAYLVGFFIFALMLSLCVFHGICLLRMREKTMPLFIPAVIFVLTAFTLIFCLNTAIGRLPLGLNSAQASRYITNMIPGFFGIYLWSTGWRPEGVRQALLGMAVVILIVASFPLPTSDVKELTWSAARKTRWKNVYLRTEDIDLANQSANFPIHPHPEQTHLKEKLVYLKQKRLNFYQDIL